MFQVRHSLSCEAYTSIMDNERKNGERKKKHGWVLVPKVIILLERLKNFMIGYIENKLPTMQF